MIPRLIGLCHDVASPLALKIAHHLSQGEEAVLPSIWVNPNAYTDADAYLADASLVALFQKNESISIPGVARKDVALSKWRDSEKQCYRTNTRFLNYLSGYYPEVDERIIQFCDNVSKRIAMYLGRLPSFVEGRYGPGSTEETGDLGDLRKSLTAVDKTSCLAGTSGAHMLTRVTMHQNRITTPEKFGLSRVVGLAKGSRWSSVPKNALTERAIAMEPGLNLYFQLGLEKAMWRRLNLLGISKSDTPSWHRYLAKHGLTLGLATLDMSMASDLWAANVIRYLLRRSPLWLSALETSRCNKMQVDGKWVWLEKFSSMGNGFTFPLQTLIFYAITREICGEDATVSVFGDDIICPADKAELVMSVLKWFGHTPNATKSHYRGAFRESCGEDFLMGVPVRPHFLKRWPSSPFEWIALSNGLLARAGHLRAFRAFALYCARQVPLGFRFGGPPELGDAVLHILRSRARLRNERGYVECRGVRQMGRRVHQDHFDSNDLLSTLLLGAVELSYGSTKKRKPVSYVPTRGTGGWKCAWFAILG